MIADIGTVSWLAAEGGAATQYGGDGGAAGPDRHRRPHGHRGGRVLRVRGRGGLLFCTTAVGVASGSPFVGKC